MYGDILQTSIRNKLQFSRTVLQLLSEPDMQGFNRRKIKQALDYISEVIKTIVNQDQENKEKGI